MDTLQHVQQLRNRIEELEMETEATRKQYFEDLMQKDQDIIVLKVRIEQMDKRLFGENTEKLILMSENTELRKKVESLKCCGNCKYYTGTICYSKDKNCRGDACKDNHYFCWEKKESK